MIPIAPKMSARLMSLQTDEGMIVQKGAVLAQLEDTDMVKSLAEQQSRVDLAEKEFARLERLIKVKAVSRQAYDEAVSNLDTARAGVARIEAEMSFLKLIAPEDGQIIKRDGEVGQLATANTPVFWMSCCAPLRVTAEVDEEDIASIKPGQSVLISADAFPDKIFKGTVQAITPKGDAISRSYRVRVTLADDTGLMPGMTAESNIIVAERSDVILVPSSAIDKDSVWIVVDGKAQKRAVDIGVRHPESAEVIQGLAISDKIILNPEAYLTDGQKIRTVEATWSLKKEK